jgi:hypothetical protein
MSANRRPAHRFDDRHIDWRPFPGYPGLSFWVLGVDDVRQTVDLLFRLDPGYRCPAHRHVGPTNTLVIEGQHRTYSRTRDGWILDQVRPPGCFASNNGDHMHSEEGGPEGAIVLLSMTAINGVIWEVIDERGAAEAAATLEDFRRALERQAPVPVSSGASVSAG